ncbi:MAG: hypothetical protein IIC11_02465 [Proteobacteria bacterium]|nr:hypothetical protein [Pseudomonadota bacterium]
MDNESPLLGAFLCPWTGGMPRVQDAWSGDAHGDGWYAAGAGRMERRCPGGGEVKYVVCAGQALIAAP